MKRLLALFSLSLISALSLVACGGDDTDSTAIATATRASAPAATDSSQTEAVMLKVGAEARAPSGALDTSKTYTATFDTEAGTFKVLLFDDEAPLTVENFINLATIGFYDGTMFHRVLENFMAQGGDPIGTGSGGPGYQFRDEFDATRRHDKPGVLSMANSGKNTNGSQFFITFAPTPHLNDVHSVFGEVVEGLDNAMGIKLRNPATAQTLGDLINSITISES